MSNTIIIQGWEIQRSPRRIESDSPTTIRLHKLGSTDNTWFTTDELRAFVDTLAFVCRKADEETTWGRSGEKP